MRPVVADRWLEMNEPIEGGVASLYNDIRGLTTIAYGNLVNAPSAVVGLPFVHSNGQLASFAEITHAWETVHTDPLCATHGWTYAAKLTDLRLTRDGMKSLALGKLRENDAVLAKRLPFWNDMPACAQMGIHSLAWACGAGFHFPRLISALNVHDYEAAAVEIHINEWTTGPTGAPIHNSGLVPRNVANKVLMRNAARVDAYHLDPDYLNWETVLASSTMPPAEPDSEAHTNMTIIENIEPENAASRPTVGPRAGSNRDEG